MICYAVIDTNVLVSALLSKHDDASTVRVIYSLYEGEFIPIFSKEIIAEYREVLSREKFKFSSDIVNLLISTIEALGENLTPKVSGIQLPDMKDLPFYEVVLEKKGSYLVTGNKKHFPKEPFVVTACEFLEILDKNQ